MKFKTLTKMFLAGSLSLFGFATGMYSYYDKGEDFQGSDQRRFVKQRNNVDLTDQGKFVSKFERYIKIFSDPIIPFNKWTQLKDTIEVKGYILENPSMHIANDGDFLFYLKLFPEYAHYGSPSFWCPDSDVIKCEINHNLRHNFPILPDLKEGDKIKVKGKYIIDTHRDENIFDHKEIHPVYRIDFMGLPLDSNKISKE